MPKKRKKSSLKIKKPSNYSAMPVKKTKKHVVSTTNVSKKNKKQKTNNISFKKGKLPVKNSERNAEMNRKIRGTVFFITGIFLLLSIWFELLAKVGWAINFFVFGIFGVIAYVVPLYLIALGIFQFLEINTFSRRKGVIVTAFLSLGFLILFGAIASSSDSKLTIDSIKEIYLSSNPLSLSGLFGVFFCMLLFPLIGKIATIIISVVLILLSALIACEFKLPKLFEDIGDDEKKSEKVNNNIEDTEF